MKTQMIRWTMGLLIVVGMSACSGEPKSEKKGSTLKDANPANYVRGVVDAGQNAKGTLGKIAIDKAIQLHRAETGKNPTSLQQLVKKGKLASVPSAPNGKKWKYNAKNGTVKLVNK